MIVGNFKVVKGAKTESRAFARGARSVKARLRAEDQAARVDREADAPLKTFTHPAARLFLSTTTMYARHVPPPKP
jgi:hypothetical protein